MTPRIGMVRLDLTHHKMAGDCLDVRSMAWNCRQWAEEVGYALQGTIFVNSGKSWVQFGMGNPYA